MSALATCVLIGRWRVVEADIWDRDYLDLSGPAIMTIGADNHAEIAFDAMQATLQIGYSPSMVFFTWTGFDEMDELSGDGDAKFIDDRTIEITFAYNIGDEAIIEAIREPSSTPC